MICYAAVFIVGNFTLFQYDGISSVGIFADRRLICVDVIETVGFNLFFGGFDYIRLVGDILNVYIVAYISVNYGFALRKVEFLTFCIVEFALYTYFVQFIAYHATGHAVRGGIGFNLEYLDVDFKSPCVARLYPRHLGKRILHKITAVFVKVVHAEIVRPGDRRSGGIARKHVREEEHPFVSARFLCHETEKTAFGRLDIVFVVAALVGNNVETELRRIFTFEQQT